MVLSFMELELWAIRWPNQALTDHRSLVIIHYQIGKHRDGLCHSCNKLETVTHFLLIYLQETMLCCFCSMYNSLKLGTA